MKTKKDKKLKKSSKGDSLKKIVKSIPFKQDGKVRNTKKKKNLKQIAKHQQNDNDGFQEGKSNEQFVDLTEQQEFVVDLVSDQFEDVGNCEGELEERQKERTPKKKKIPKIRRSATDENVDDNFMIVPWASKEEWDNTCVHFHQGNYNQVMKRIAVWQTRVPVLPVGVEASLFLLEALVYDTKFVESQRIGGGGKGLYTEDQARSLYSLAIIRYLNHVSHLAAHSLGGEGGSKITRELAATVDTPEWLVSLRNDVSHGASAPSVEVLRMGGNFVLQWLKQKYWRLPEDEQEIGGAATKDPFTILSTENGEDADIIDVPQKISDLFAAYIATRIYKLRKQFLVTDPEITRHINGATSTFSAVKTKEAMKSLRNSLRFYLSKHPSLFASLFCQEIVPSLEFYENFKQLLNLKKINDEDKEKFAFDKFYGLWMPLVRTMESKGKLIWILGTLAQVIVNQEFQKVWPVTARWIDKLLEIIENSGKKYSKHLVNMLEVVIKRPNHAMHSFLERLFRLTEPRIGAEAVGKLGYLASLWIEEKQETKKRKRQAHKYFTVGDIEELGGSGPTNDDAEVMEVNGNGTSTDQLTEGRRSLPWMADERGEDFWRKVPIGSILSSS